MGVVEVRAWHLEGMQHRAEWNQFAFRSDEPAQLGGLQEHPIPIAYFTASVALCAMTQVVRFAEQLKVPLNGLRARAASDWDREGSVLAGTVLANCLGFEIALEIESTAPPEHIAAVVQNAHAGCFAERALISPVAPNGTATLGGKPLDFDSAPRETHGDPDPTIKHFPVEVDLIYVGGVSHEARWKEFTFLSDEPPHLGGRDEHPIPIAYFVGSVGFCALTQIVRYARQMKIPISSITSRTASHFSRTGSVLAGSVEAKLDAFDIHVDIESKASPEAVATLLRNAHAGCYAQQALVRPVAVASTVVLNGSSLDVEQYPRRIEGRR